MKAWIGSTVKPSNSQRKEMNGNSAVIGGSGKKAMNVRAPMVISGAVSPSARDRPMMMPVRTPGIAAGRTWSRVTCPFVAPIP